MKYFLLFGIGQGLLLFLALAYKSAINKNNAWLIGLFVLFISAILSGPLLNEWLGEPAGSFLVDPLILLIGPSFYLYIRSFSAKPKAKDYLLHGLPFLLYLPVLAVFYHTAVRSALSQPSLQTVYSSAFAVSIGLLKFLHLFLYVSLSFSALRAHRAKVKRVFADLEGKDLAWLRYMLGAFVFLAAISLVLYVAALQYPAYQNQLTLLNLALLSAFILTLSFYAFHQHTLFDYAGSRADTTSIEAVMEEKSAPKYEKSGLAPDEAAEIEKKIRAFIEAKGYLDPNVTMGALSVHIGVPPHKVSEVLGKYMATSFYDLINRHRVEDIKRALRDPALAHLTLLAIAYDYGYNSKSTFNAAFKKFTGRTPSAFKNASA